MVSTRVTELPGDKLRRAIDEFAGLKKLNPDMPKERLIEQVCRKFDLSPLESDFLQRQLQDEA